jgi:hypothetical protein
MYRKIAAAAAILTAGLTIGAPAFAALEGPGANDPGAGVPPSTTTTAKPVERPKPTTSTTAKPAETPKPPRSEEPKPTTTTTAAPTGSAPSAPGTEEHRDVEQHRLQCVAATSGDTAGARCEWSPSHAPTFARYLLWRQDPGKTERRVVFQSSDRAVTTYGDKPLSPGTYHYGLLVLDGANKGVGIGGPVEVTIPVPPAAEPKPVVMSLECKPVPSPTRVVCRWSMSSSERFAGYRLFREAPGTPAQVRFTTADRNVTTATDDGVQPGATYKYRVVTVDGDGRVIGSGGPVTVTIPAGTGDAPIR